MVAARSCATFGHGQGRDRRAQRRGPPLLPGQARSSIPTSDADKEDKERNRDARVWFRGLQAIRTKVGIKTIYDLSATPFYLKGSGYNEGFIFPWVVSDFSLMDAIESGIVKVPRIPVDDDAAGEQLVYLHLWDNIGTAAARSATAKDVEHGAAGWVPPETLEGALRSLYRSYERRFARLGARARARSASRRRCSSSSARTRSSRSSSSTGSPAETSSSPTARRGSSPGNLPLLTNVDDGAWTTRQRTILVDSAQLESGEPLGADFKKDAAHEIEAFKQRVPAAQPRRRRRQAHRRGPAARGDEHDRQEGQARRAHPLRRLGLDAHRGLGRQHRHAHPRHPPLRQPAPVRAGRRPRPAPAQLRRQRRRAASSPSTPRSTACRSPSSPATSPRQAEAAPRPAIEVRALDERWRAAHRVPEARRLPRRAARRAVCTPTSTTTRRCTSTRRRSPCGSRAEGIVGDVDEQVDLDDIRSARAQQVAFAIAADARAARRVRRRTTASERPWLFPQLVDICRAMARRRA